MLSCLLGLGRRVCARRAAVGRRERVCVTSASAEHTRGCNWTLHRRSAAVAHSSLRSLGDPTDRTQEACEREARREQWAHDSSDKGSKGRHSSSVHQSVARWSSMCNRSSRPSQRHQQAERDPHYNNHLHRCAIDGDRELRHVVAEKSGHSGVRHSKNGDRDKLFQLFAADSILRMFALISIRMVLNLYLNTSYRFVCPCYFVDEAKAVCALVVRSAVACRAVLAAPHTPLFPVASSSPFSLVS